MKEVSDMDINEVRQELLLLKEQCSDFDKLIAEKGVFNVLMQAQYGVLPPKEFIEICEAFVYLSKSN